ncbi:hypothetical protein MRS76_25625 [Rhizobiaceae bacterium n13]|uniref:Peptidase M10 serralysin C-terminal domain-containing protein n=1 Tax=Ferirhizobium litorale TaxID=2927786 RepID=A0AAE3U4R5_9HYPH|nr:hypothetical protein [Fererhizobium litorale]MDI7865279.1 hypothetical protein [Fererhizobium litorale]MDI7925182.1 hypothetical protein [Fererhizobium litorale]
MAKIQIGAALGPWEWLGDVYDGNTLTLVSKSATKAVYKDAEGDRIVLTGTGLTYTGNFATGGTVTGARFVNQAGDDYLTLTNGNFAAASVFAEVKDKDIFGLFTVLTSGNDNITGSVKGDDLLIGRNAGNDTIRGLGGDDFIKGSGGNNTMNGGKGFDVLSYEETNWDTAATKGVVVDLTVGTVENSWGGVDTISNFEELRGSKFADTFLGGENDDVFVGFQGKDKFRGREGEDELRYHLDQKYGGNGGIDVDLRENRIVDGFGKLDNVDGIERISGTYFNDVFRGNGADNTFKGLSGKDSYNGRSGSDTLSFDWWEDLGQKGVVVDFRRATGNIRDDGFGNVETANNIENVEGSRLADDITLGSSDGWASGGRGDDRLVAGAGQNWLAGNAGADTFVFLSIAKSPTATPDSISDFSQGQADKIDVSKVASFEFIGTAEFSGTGPELAYKIINDETIINGDTDGDGESNFTVVIQKAVNLQESDFLL